jgi:hypothetical protein
VDESYSFEAVHADAQQLCDRLLSAGKNVIEVRTSLASMEQMRSHSEVACEPC